LLGIVLYVTTYGFRALVWKYWKEQGRHDLPWRKTVDPYKILVSEVMLQQTQVERVIPYYKKFLRKFPTVRKLAEAPLSEVLILWQGLGYNRRAKMLHEAAKAVVKEYGGSFPKNASELEKLPGIGPYTAGAVAAFAYNQDGIFVETNIRTVVTHHFFLEKDTVLDSDVRKILEDVFPEGCARDWYAALMDYGAHLKRSGVRINAKAKGYMKQSTFKGSGREVRGAIIRGLSQGAVTRKTLNTLFDADRQNQVEEQMQKLLQEKLIVKTGNRFSLPD
jgi:A/G-specific adenine glycosylase